MMFACPFCAGHEDEYTVAVGTSMVNGIIAASLRCSRCGVQWVSFDAKALDRIAAFRRTTRGQDSVELLHAPVSVN